MKKKKIAILGGGNIGGSIAEGLIETKLFAPGLISVTRRKVNLIEHLKKKGIHTHADNGKAVSDSGIIIIAVQPNQIIDLLKEVKSKLNPNKHILISVVTGVSLKDIQTVVEKKIPLFRAMPNTAIAIQESMTCLSTNNTTKEQQQLVVSIFDQLGKAILIDEELMQAATVLGACGIAYSLRFIRAASQGGIEIGFDANIAQLIATQTVKGAATLLLDKGYHPEWEIDKVTTPKGCTIVGLNEMEHRGFSSAFIKGIITSYKKISEITEEYIKKKFESLKSRADQQTNTMKQRDQYINHLNLELGLSQTEIARIGGISQSTVSWCINKEIARQKAMKLPIT